VQYSERTARIRELNDDFRVRLNGDGVIALTVAVKNFHSANKALEAVRAFNDFTSANDPYGEHDFGAVEVRGERFFFKIDYYNLTLNSGSEDAADPTKTRRVMTIMRAGEY
jgi:hypothetical protein